MDLLRVHGHGFEDEAPGEADVLELLLDVIPATVEDDGFVDIIEKVHLVSLAAKILAFGVADANEQGV